MDANLVSLMEKDPTSRTVFSHRTRAGTGPGIRAALFSSGQPVPGNEQQQEADQDNGPDRAGPSDGPATAKKE